MIDESLYKVPPQNLPYEESIIAGCLLFPDVCEETLDILTPEDFYKTAHQKIYKAILDLKFKKEPVDLLTVSEKLKSLKTLEDCGGAYYLTKLTDECPVPTHTGHTIQKIRECAVLRKTIELCNKTIQNCFNLNDTPEKTIDKFQTAALKIDIDLDNNNFIYISNIIEQRIDQYEEMSRNGKVFGIQTGFYKLDILTGGLKGSKFIIIAARPRIGKTALMMNLADNMASSGHKVGIFSIEMDKEELIDRLISSKSKVNLIKLTTGNGIGAEEWQSITNAASKIYDYQIIIDDTGGLEIQELKRRARKMVKEGVEIIFIDQLSKIRGGKGKSEYEQRSYIVNELAILKKDLRIPICLLAQINRKLEDRQNKKPTLGDLKSTGSLEEDADIIFLGHRKYEYTKAEEDIHHAEWELAKQRQGPTYNIPMYWDGKTVTFSSIQD